MNVDDSILWKTLLKYYRDRIKKYKSCRNVITVSAFEF